MHRNSYEFLASRSDNQPVSLEWVVQDGRVALTQIGFDVKDPVKKSARKNSFLSSFEQDSLIPEEIAWLVGEIQNYFEQGREISRVPWEWIDLSALSPFQRQVYQAICRIPHGETRTYGWVAYQLQNPAASRAVGQALKNNPFPLLIPCHRVVSTQSLGGFMGSDDPNQNEVKIKQKLLSLEDRYRNPIFPFLMGATA